MSQLHTSVEIVARAARFLPAILAFAFWGCGPSAEERQAEALLVRAQELALVGGKYQARWAAHMQAEKTFKEVVSLYPRTNAAAAAKKGLERMPGIYEAVRKVAAEELKEKYEATMGQILEASKFPR